MRRLLVSFSGGRTSAYMAHLIKERLAGEYELLFVFANTGQERLETLDFVRRCDEHFGLGVVWVEALINAENGKGTRYRVVSWESASRHGEPFEEMIKKYGIPNQAYPHCTRELKVAPIHSYVRGVGWADYKTAIGIRADEPNRIGIDPNFIYPMNDWMIDKIDVNNFWESMPFNLDLLEHEGNCSWCWKKSDKKHMMLLKKTPEIYDFPKKMEGLYGLSGSNVDGNKRVFFRRNRSTQDMINTYNLIATDGGEQIQLFGDEGGGCSESCEAFGETAKP